MSDVEAVATALSVARSAVDAAPDSSWGVVKAVNADGTVSVETGTGLRPSVRCLRSYTTRTPGDRVLLLSTAAGPVVIDAIGAGPTPAQVTEWDAMPPVGEGWREVVSGSVWVRFGNQLWVRPSVALPPGPSTVVQSAVGFGTYRGGVLLHGAAATQGDPDGTGLRTGLAVFGSWAALAGKTATGGTITVHRRASDDGARGQVPIYAWRGKSGAVTATTPAIEGDSVLLTAAPNESPTVSFSAGWAQYFCVHSDTAILLYSEQGGDVAEVDSVTVTIAHS